MDVQRFIDQTTNVIISFLPNLIGGLAVLIVGCIAALIAAALVRGLLRRTELDNHLAALLSAGKPPTAASLERVVGKTVFAVLMLFVLVAFFQALGLTLVTDPLNAVLSTLSTFAPQLLGALLILGIAIVVGTLTRTVVHRGLGTRFDAPSEVVGLGKRLGHAMYWLVLLLFLPGILGALGLDGMLDPVRAMATEMLGFLPNLVGASLILLVGWVGAGLLRRSVANVLRSAGVDEWSAGAGAAPVLGSAGPSGLVSTFVHALVLLAAVVAALNALQIDAVTVPVSALLEQILGAVPGLLAAALLIAIAFMAGRIAADLVSRTLSAAGCDRLPALLGIATPERSSGGTLSTAAGTLVLWAVAFLAIMESARLLGFDQFAALLSTFVVIAGRIALGVLVFGVGLYLGNLAASSVSSSRVQYASLLATLARIAVVVFTGSMALRATGVADNVVDLAFGLTYGALAVAAAIAFGLGSRDTAGRLVEEWTGQLRRRPSSSGTAHSSSKPGQGAPD